MESSTDSKLLSWVEISYTSLLIFIALVQLTDSMTIPWSVQWRFRVSQVAYWSAERIGRIGMAAESSYYRAVTGG